MTNYKSVTPCDFDIINPNAIFLLALKEIFNEPGDFEVEFNDEMIILTTKSGKKIRAFAREILYNID